MAQRMKYFRWLLAVLVVGIVGMISTSILAAPQPDSRMAVSLKDLPDVSGHTVPPGMRPQTSVGRLTTKVWVVWDGETWRALSNRSTHLGCLVEWMPEKELLEDICLNDLWDRSGRPAGGPAFRGLDQYPVTVEGDYLVIDLGRPIIDRR